MIVIQKRLQIFENDINEVLHIFKKYIDINDLNIFVSSRKIKNGLKIKVEIDASVIAKSVNLIGDVLADKRIIKKAIKTSIYSILSTRLNVRLPWGSLTGVRPTKVVFNLYNDGYDFDEIKTQLVNDYGTTLEKANLAIETFKKQSEIKVSASQIDLYIHIPICPTRCSYCSFISSELKYCKHLLSDYVNCLIKELEAVKTLVNKKNLVIKNIYMGGGTPTVLGAEDLNKILQVIDFKFNEFTVECGRPDTISKEKLQVLENYGVTRISINPQTLNDSTLQNIGRMHTSTDFYNCYNLAKNFNFKINTDLIAGLPNESFEDFKNTLDRILELAPNNITIHTFAVKRASKINETKENVDDFFIEDMIVYAYNTLKNNHYFPYYLYRQKNMLGLFENVGYYKDNSICEFNIESMEDMIDIIACGAGAISKRIFRAENRIERSANVKQIKDYIERIDEMIERKYDLFC